MITYLILVGRHTTVVRAGLCDGPKSPWIGTGRGRPHQSPCSPEFPCVAPCARLPPPSVPPGRVPRPPAPIITPLHISPAPFSPGLEAWLHPSACGGSQWTRPRRRPPPRDPRGGPACEGWAGEGRAEVVQSTPACLTHAPLNPLQLGKTPLDIAQNEGKAAAAAAALLLADPRVSAAAGKA